MMSNAFSISSYMPKSNEKEIVENKIYLDNSSLIEYISYNQKALLLQVKYQRGRYKNQLLSYNEITTEEFNRIMEAKSKGRALLKVIETKKGGDGNWCKSLIKLMK